jgi:hypothetical protein
MLAFVYYHPSQPQLRATSTQSDWYYTRRYNAQGAAGGVPRQELHSPVSHARRRPPPRHRDRKWFGGNQLGDYSQRTKDLAHALAREQAIVSRSVRVPRGPGSSSGSPGMSRVVARFQRPAAADGQPFPSTGGQTFLSALSTGGQTSRLPQRSNAPEPSDVVVWASKSSRLRADYRFALLPLAGKNACPTVFRQARMPALLSSGRQDACPTDEDRQDACPTDEDRQDACPTAPDATARRRRSWLHAPASGRCRPSRPAGSAGGRDPRRSRATSQSRR